MQRIFKAALAAGAILIYSNPLGLAQGARISGTKAPVSIELPGPGWQIERGVTNQDTYCTRTNMTLAIWYEPAKPPQNIAQHPTVLAHQSAIILTAEKAEKVAQLLRRSTVGFRVLFFTEKPVTLNNKVWMRYSVEAVSHDDRRDVHLLIYAYSDFDMVLVISGAATSPNHTGSDAAAHRVADFVASSEALEIVEKMMQSIQIEKKPSEK